MLGSAGERSHCQVLYKWNFIWEQARRDVDLFYHSLLDLVTQVKSLGAIAVITLGFKERRIGIKCEM
jgi:hypothetical protein